MLLFLFRLRKSTRNVLVKLERACHACYDFLTPIIQYYNMFQSYQTFFQPLTSKLQAVKVRNEKEMNKNKKNNNIMLYF